MSINITSQSKQPKQSGRCNRSKKRRFRDHTEAITALHRAANARRNANFDGASTNRHEIRTYECDWCQGWHLTSRSNVSTTQTTVTHNWQLAA